MAVATIVIVRLLSIDEYAIYTKFHSISVLSTTIIGTGLALAYVRFAAEKVSRGQDNSFGLFKLCSLLVCLATIISFIAIPIINKSFNTTFFISIISLIYGGVLALNKMNQSYFQVDERFSTSGIITNIKNITLCLGVAVLPIFFSNITATQTIYATIISAIIAYLIGYIYISKNSTTQTFSSDKSLLRALFKESWWLIIYSLLVCLFDQGCVIIMSHIASIEDIAIYGVASKYYALMLTFLSSLMTVLRIRTSNQSMVDSKDNRKAFVLNWIKRVWWIAGAVCLCTILVSRPVLTLLNGNEYIDAVPVFNILVVGVFIGYIFAPNVAVMMSAKRYKELCALALISFIINCVICVTLIPKCGAIGAAVAVVISNAFLNIVSTLIIYYDKKD
ncbi:MAG: oligosaccharide flippase family protein [Alistipes sp.]|nr:oligosaccharide flippase family protein [Alistipes sp.]